MFAMNTAKIKFSISARELVFWVWILQIFEIIWVIFFILFFYYIFFFARFWLSEICLSLSFFDYLVFFCEILSWGLFLARITSQIYHYLCLNLSQSRALKHIIFIQSVYCIIMNEVDNISVVICMKIKNMKL